MRKSTNLIQRLRELFAMKFTKNFQFAKIRVQSEPRINRNKYERN